MKETDLLEWRPITTVDALEIHPAPRRDLPQQFQGVLRLRATLGSLDLLKQLRPGIQLRPEFRLDRREEPPECDLLQPLSQELHRPTRGPLGTALLQGDHGNRLRLERFVDEEVPLVRHEAQTHTPV